MRSLLILLVFSTLLIFFQFSTIPAHLAYDELHFARIALSLDHQPYTSYSPLSSGHATLYFYTILMSLKTLGITTVALRLPSALFGILVTIPAFLIFSQVFKKNHYAFIATLIFITSRWYFSFARFSFEATFLIFLELTSLYFLLRFLKNRSTASLIACSLFAGLAFHSYYPGKLFFIIPLILIGLMGRIKPIFLYLAVFLLIASPLLLYYARHPDIRLSELSIFSAKDLSINEKITQVGQNIKSELLMFHVVGDGNGRHNYPFKPAVNSVVGVFFLLGLGLSVRMMRSKNHLLFLLYFALSLLPPLFTYSWENPNMLRTVTALFPLVYFAMVGVQYLNNRFDTRVYYLAVIFLLIGSLYDIRTYFVYQSRVFKNAFEVTCPLSRVVQYEVPKIPKECRVKKNLY